MCEVADKRGVPLPDVDINEPTGETGESTAHNPGMSIFLGGGAV